MAYHPIIQKEVDVLSAKGAIEPSAGGAGSYLDACAVLSTLVFYDPYSV